MLAPSGANEEMEDLGMCVRPRMIVIFVTIVILITAFASRPAEQQKEFSNWPDGTSPQVIGKRVAENFIVRQFRAQSDPTKAGSGIIYPEVCAWYGALAVAQLTRDNDLQARLIRKLDQLMTPPDSGMISQNAHVDYRVFGVVPLEVYIQTKAQKYLDLGKGFADRQWADPTPDGVTREARYWIDDMYMITAVQVQAYRATRDLKYIDRAALTMAAYLGKLQQPNGLFFHALDTPFYWSRGNGWVAAGMAELLRSLPKKHASRERIMAGYKKMMAALLKYQGKNGLWRQLIDRPEAWSETSGTGMFTFAMVTGVKNGWLDAKTYGQAARAAWLGLVNSLDKDGNVADVCAGTNKLNDLDYYLTRPRIPGDLHGQAPILWSAAALIR
jgi:unsaturated rhamnogalacturonyl hydrolase